MKLTKRQLKKIIKEEYTKLLNEQTGVKVDPARARKKPKKSTPLLYWDKSTKSWYRMPGTAGLTAPTPPAAQQRRSAESEFEWQTYKTLVSPDYSSGIYHQYIKDPVTGQKEYRSLPMTNADLNDYVASKVHKYDHIAKTLPPYETSEPISETVPGHEPPDEGWPIYPGSPVYYSDIDVSGPRVRELGIGQSIAAPEGIRGFSPRFPVGEFEGATIGKDVDIGDVGFYVTDPNVLPWEQYERPTAAWVHSQLPIGAGLARSDFAPGESFDDIMRARKVYDSATGKPYWRLPQEIQDILSEK